MLPTAYSILQSAAIARELDRLLAAARRRLQLAVECDPAEAALALLAAAAILAAEARS
jgi:hypothetical protein